MDSQCKYVPSNRLHHISYAEISTVKKESHFFEGSFLKMEVHLISCILFQPVFRAS